MQRVTIQGEKREATGKASNKVLRNHGRIPAIIYGGEENISFSTTPSEVKTLVYTPDFKMAAINIEGAEYNCILKDIQFHPVSDEIVHIDFLRTVEGHPIKYAVPVKFKGVSPGVKAGGKLIQQMRKVKLKSLPSAMVDAVYSDISDLELGSATRVRDLEIPEGVSVESEGATPVAIVEVPRALKSAQTAEAKEAAAEAVEE